MGEFVSYTGPNASQDLETRRKIRSQVMRDFRRRQRDNDQIPSHGPERRSRKNDKRNNAAKERTSTSLAKVGNVRRPEPIYNSSARLTLDQASEIDSTYTSRSNSSLSTTPELVSSNPNSLRDGYVPNDNRVYAAAKSHAATSIPHTTPAVYVSRPQIESQEHVPDLAARNGSVVKYHRPATFQSQQARFPCRACLQRIDGCRNCISNEFHNRSHIPDLGTTESAYQNALALDLDSTPHYDISLLPSSSANDREALQYFQRVVVKDVSGIVAIGFWERLVPLMCHMDDAARQAAIALSQAHMEQTAEAWHVPHRGYSGLTSLQSEIKASQALRAYIDNAASPSHELVLTCSIMLHTLESMLGRQQSASLHLENGLRMYKAWQKERQHSASNVNEESHALSTAFARLDLSATISVDDRIPLFEYDDGNIPSLSEHELLRYMAFTNSRDAHHQLMRIGTPAWGFLIRNRRWRKVDPHLVPSEAIEEQDMHRKRYRAWSVAMDMYESDRLRYNNAAITDNKNDRRAELMSLLATRMHYWCAKQMLEESLPREKVENVWDRNPHKLLRQARAILEYTEEVKTESGHKGQSSFSPEIGICGILLCLAHRTALPHIRSEALGLAQSFDRKEGSKDLCGAFTSWTRLPPPRPPFPFMLDQPGH